MTKSTKHLHVVFVLILSSQTTVFFNLFQVFHQHFIHSKDQFELPKASLSGLTCLLLSCPSACQVQDMLASLFDCTPADDHHQNFNTCILTSTLSPLVGKKKSEGASAKKIESQPNCLRKCVMTLTAQNKIAE